MKFSFLFSFITFCALFSFAQSPFGVSKEVFKKSLYHIEISAGAMSPSIGFSGTPFDNIQRSFGVDKTGGLAFRVQFKEKISFSTQIAYRSASVSIPEYNDYCIRAHYINLFTPFEFNCNIIRRKRKSDICFLLFAGPYVANNMGGDMSVTGNSIKLTASEINQFDYGFESGLGMRIPVYSLGEKSNITIKASYVCGLANTYPVSLQKYTSNEQSKFLLSTQGNRYVRGVQFSLTYEILLEKKAASYFTAGGDGKKTYKKFLVH